MLVIDDDDMLLDFLQVCLESELPDVVVTTRDVMQSGASSSAEVVDGAPVEQAKGKQGSAPSFVAGINLILVLAVQATGLSALLGVVRCRGSISPSGTKIAQWSCSKSLIAVSLATR